MSHASRVREIIGSWGRGELSNGSVFDTIVHGLDLQNIAEVVDALPDEWRRQVIQDFTERAAAQSSDELIDVVGAVFAWESEPDAARQEQMRQEYAAECKRDRERYWNVTLPAIRWWLETQQSP